MGPFVLKLSGHVFDREDLVREYVALISQLWSMGHRMALVVGGGGLARRYIGLARSMGSSESMADQLGIFASRLNALLIISGLGHIAYPTVPTSLEEVMHGWLMGKLVVLGGLQPGQSTATVAILVAEYLGLREVVDCANVDAIYTGDPRRDPGAKRLGRVSVSQLMDILRGAGALAGTYDPLDPWALRIAQRSRIRVYVVHCAKPSLVRDLVVEGRLEGTVIEPD